MTNRKRRNNRFLSLFLASFGRNDLSRFSLGFTPRSLHRRRRSYYKVAPLGDSRGQKVALASVESSALQAASPAESGRREECEKLDSPVLNMNSISPDVSQQKDSGIVSKVHNTSSNQPREPQASEVKAQIKVSSKVLIVLI